MHNIVVLAGNLGNDPETFYGSEGDGITSFNLAFTSGKEKTSWIKCICFNKTAEVAEKYLHTGARIALSGYLKQNSWANNEGEKRSNHEVVVTSIEFIKINGEDPQY